MQPLLFTIGHSTHPLERFLALLTQHQIEIVADIRRFPGSGKYRKRSVIPRPFSA